MTDMMAEIAAFDGRTAKIVGPARSGKTEALLRRAAAAVAAGCAPEDILIETSTAEAARVARRRLVDALAAAGVQDVEDIAGRITVACAQQVCLAVLETPEARAATGHTPRVLAPFECNFFLEDMKTLGTPARRLRSELGHIKKQWCALAPEDDWAVGEEKDVLELAHRLLGATNAMLEDEVAYLCGRYLQSDAGAGARQRFSLALADDFQNLSVAQQTSCVCSPAISSSSPAIPNETVRVATSFPAPEGFATFDTQRRNVTVFALDTAFGNPNVTAFCDAVVRAGRRGGACGRPARGNHTRHRHREVEHAGRGIQRADALPVRRERRKS